MRTLFGSFLLAAAAIWGFSGCYVGRVVWWNMADIRDHKRLPALPVSASAQPQRLAENFAENNGLKLPKSVNRRGKELAWDDFLDKTQTVAILVLRDDTILYEKYLHKYAEKSIVASFSMSKSYVGALIGIAVNEGFIKSTNEPIKNYLQEFRDKPEFDSLTIQHLLDMCSGIDFNESYFNPFGGAARTYYGKNLPRYISRLKIRHKPGTTFEYLSINSQLLGMILERATGKTLADYLQEKIWQPMGMESDASWSIDDRRHRTGKGFCCLNATARDFAKLGLLYMHGGQWNGAQLIPADWVRQTAESPTSLSNNRYKNQWWHSVRCDSIQGCRPTGNYCARGFLGQFVYVCPAKKLVFVRLGKRPGRVRWTQLFQQIADAQ